jgi:hypothetical protein
LDLILSFDANLDGSDDVEFFWTALSQRILYQGKTGRTFTNDSKD